LMTPPKHFSTGESYRVFPRGESLELRAPLFAVRANSDINLGTHLTGDEEVFVGAPGAATPADSKAQGQAIFRVNDDGTVDFRLIASNIECRCSMRSGAGSPMSTFTRTMEWACLTPDLGISRVERFAGRSITKTTRRQPRKVGRCNGEKHDAVTENPRSAFANRGFFRVLVACA